MEPQAPASLEGALAASIQVQAYNYASLPAYVILYYDYLLTINDEIQLIWPNKSLGVVSLVFYLNRYVSLLGHVPFLVGIYILSLSPEKSQAGSPFALISNVTYVYSKACRGLLKYHQYLAGLIQIIAGTALSCRTYALYGRRRRVLYPLLALGLAVIGFGLWALHDMELTPGSSEQLPPIGCVSAISHADASHYAALWIGMFLFDLIIFLMTVYKSIKRWKEDEFHQDTTLLHILLRDGEQTDLSDRNDVKHLPMFPLIGTIYFGVMVLLTLSVVVSFFIMPDYDKGITTSLANVLSSVMVSRLLFNLRNPLINSNRNFRPNTLTTMMDTTYSLNDSECISNGEVFLNQLGGTPRYVPDHLSCPRGIRDSEKLMHVFTIFTSAMGLLIFSRTLWHLPDSEIMLLTPNARVRTASDATSATAIEILHGHVPGEEEKFVNDANPYQRKIVDSF
ncbi:hypothetical protein NP233_g4882 [Leucocoprinus birnbaumii]|uniref:DUF6533 domain-containing protein n=1 Tax=Leucocoprinus birnbaumii TaxID=56174 RepID=A0AAD5VTZ2_9AGAR|nr:hypothetical protein NP233_g4882 [Leucocoprinus birnbaumii]